MSRRGRMPLRALLALAAALALAACRVDVDGAPCRTAGETVDCPGGQACGNDLRCSARALACVATRCAPGATECTDASSARRCDGAADAVCGRWVADTCAARDPECRIMADPSLLSPSRTARPPAGIPQPPECRFARLGDALAAAAERAPAAATAWIDGQAGVAAEFGAITGEGWPLVVAANVTLLPVSPQPAPVIRGEPGISPLVAVQGAVDGVRVEGGGATGVGIALSCGAAGRPELRGVAVDGGGAVDPDGLVTAGLSSGVSVAATCGARLASVEVSNAAGAALSIDPAAAGTVEVLGGRFGASNVGIWTRGQKVRVLPDPDAGAGTVVSGNSAEGVIVGGVAVEATLELMTVAGNGGTGIFMQGPTGASRILVRGCDVSGNGASRATKYGPAGARRTGGGVLVSLGPIAEFTFKGNRLWANAGDQLAFESGADWSIAAPECGADSNVFACLIGESSCSAGGGACAVALSGGSLQAPNNKWPIPPSAYALGNVTIGPYCDREPGVPAEPCP